MSAQRSIECGAHDSDGRGGGWLEGAQCRCRYACAATWSGAHLRQGPGTEGAVRQVSAHGSAVEQLVLADDCEAGLPTGLQLGLLHAWGSHVTGRGLFACNGNCATHEQQSGLPCAAGSPRTVPGVWSGLMA